MMADETPLPTMSWMSSEYLMYGQFRSIAQGLAMLLFYMIPSPLYHNASKKNFDVVSETFITCLR